MKFLRVILIIAVFTASYMSVANAFASLLHCHKPMAAGKMMDCCKNKDGKPMKCPCPASYGCVTLSPAMLGSVSALPDAPDSAVPQPHPVVALAQATPPPEFRPPDFLY